jgi:hypothetical protein
MIFSFTVSTIGIFLEYVDGEVPVRVARPFVLESDSYGRIMPVEMNLLVRPEPSGAQDHVVEAAHLEFTGQQILILFGLNRSSREIA